MQYLKEEELASVTGGTYCSIFDVGCWSWGVFKSVIGTFGPSAPHPEACIPKSSWNPVPPVPCP
ncbi:hypothetical protein HMPREF9182_1203 [Streptococcus sp. oral taxon 056 str. F0418]|uniref:hypothetical protein n=1 Tax=Streptococcus sp. oral taxon 056 TaxID=712620 RepID=UPI00021805C6|nr:hypothetical protein [Streptococcus sp. oral taxon 056]EGP66068.1 hypothetical protein HMPREF9182_1203 [Streptococcus sp. oral taxon 056 str. F0418]